MRQSRRSFFDVLAGGRSDASHDTGLWIAARGHEDYQAQAAQASQPGAAAPRRPELPPGVKAIRISSNENPLGPGKAVLDAIMHKFPEAGRYPFNSTPGGQRAGHGHRDQVQREAGERGPRRRFPGDSAECRPRVHVADSRPRDRRSDVRKLHAVCEETRTSSRRDQGRRVAPARPRRHGRRREGRRPGVPEQPEQPDRDRPRQQGRRRLRAARARRLARHGNPHRRGVSRLRDRPVVRERDSSRACRRRTCSLREPSRRRTAWPACGSATASVRPAP